MRGAALVWIAVCGVVATAGAARADFRVCNKTRSLINLAIGAVEGANFVTEGWWTAPPGACSTPIRGAIKSRYLYLYATDIDGADLVKGAVSMCVDRGKFRAFGLSDCWRRGYLAVNFAEIDTQISPDWTTFVTEVGK